MKKIVGVGDLLSGALKRHGIERQVNAAIVVDQADNLLKGLLPPHAQADVRALSYQNEELRIVCRHPAAAEAVRRATNELLRSLEQEFPSQVFRRVVCRLGNPSDQGKW